VVVVVRDRLHDLWRPAEADVLPDERELRARRDEAVDEVLRERAVDLPDGLRRQQGAVDPRIEDVDVEAVLMRDVPEAAEVRAERPAVGQAEVADEDPRRARVGEAVVAQHRQQEGEQAVGAPAAFGPVRADAARAVPRHPVGAARRQLQAVDERALVRPAGGDRAHLRHVHRWRRRRRAGDRQRRTDRAGGARAAGSRARARDERQRFDLQHAHVRDRLAAAAAAHDGAQRREADEAQGRQQSQARQCLSRRRRARSPR
jgi:hypothetical protein